MIDCAECEARLRPESPHQPFFDPRTNRYLRPLCESCPNRGQEKVYPQRKGASIGPAGPVKVRFVPMPAPKSKGTQKPKTERLATPGA